MTDKIPTNYHPNRWDWSIASHPCGISMKYIDTSPQKTVALAKRFGSWAVDGICRLPRIGYESRLANFESFDLWIVNNAGQYSIEQHRPL